MRRERSRAPPRLEARLSKSPKDPGLLLEAILTLKNLGHYEDALAHARRAAVLRPQDAYVHFLRAEIECGLGLSAACAASLKKSAAASPTTEVFVRAVDTLILAGLYTEALGEAKRAVKLHPKDL